MPDFIKCFVTIEGMAPYSQSHMHDEPKLEGEQPDAYDLRTWRSKMNTAVINGKKTMIIPKFSFQRSVVGGAQFSKKKIPGLGNSTWTKRFESGISVVSDGSLNIDPDTVKCVALPMNSDGMRGSGKRVTRRLPQIYPPWEATFEVWVLDALITEDVFEEMVQSAGLFIGLGQYRPENGGSNGRFEIKDMKWEDNRRLVPHGRLA